jgi:hypothetical protein
MHITSTRVLQEEGSVWDEIVHDEVMSDVECHGGGGVAKMNSYWSR